MIWIVIICGVGLIWAYWFRLHLGHVVWVFAWSIWLWASFALFDGSCNSFGFIFLIEFNLFELLNWTDWHWLHLGLIFHCYFGPRITCYLGYQWHVDIILLLDLRLHFNLSFLLDLIVDQELVVEMQNEAQDEHTWRAGFWLWEEQIESMFSYLFICIYWFYFVCH